MTSRSGRTARGRLWRALNQRAGWAGLPRTLSATPAEIGVGAARARCQGEGNTYRVIAEVWFGAKRVPERASKTHDLRNRTIRLFQSGFAPMGSGYRGLLQQSCSKK
jgi:hypothetical protein